MSGGGNSVNPEMLINIDAGAIVAFQLIVSYFVLKVRHVSAMISGFIVASIGIGITFYTGNGIFTIIGIVIFAIGEMMTNPTFSSFIALISPKGKEALYMGTYFLPIFLGNFLTTFISGNLYQAWSDKLSLLQTEMATRAIEMPEITQEFTKNDYFNLASEKMGMTQVEMTQFIWDTYNPNKIWYVIVGIGIVTILALSIYDRLVIRPKEAKAA
jgi:MFS family permease